MNWFWIALIGPFLWSVGNHLDKYLLSKYFKNTGIGALIIFSSLIGVVILPIILLFQADVFSLSLIQAIVIMLAGVSVTTGLLIYLYALEHDEASIVASLFQAIPVFGYILGAIFLREFLNTYQIIGAVLIIGAGIAISWNIDTNKFKARIFWLMMIASLLIAIESLLFKIFALQTDFWTASFWEYAGTGLLGAVLMFVTAYRREFLVLWKNYKIRLIALNSANEIMTVIGILTSRFALLLAPMALVQTVNGFQPFFVFLMGITLSFFFPKLGRESLQRRHLIQKIVAIIIMIIGAYLIEHNN